MALPPPDSPCWNADRRFNSPEVQEKLAAKTHHIGVKKTFCEVEGDFNDPDSLNITSWLSPDGQEVVSDFLLWRVSKKERPQCGARCRDGHSCTARVVVRPDGTFTKRCRLHGGLSPKSLAPFETPMQRKPKKKGTKAQRRAKNQERWSERLWDDNFDDALGYDPLLENRASGPVEVVSDQELAALLVKVGAISPVAEQRGDALSIPVPPVPISPQIAALADALSDDSDDDEEDETETLDMEALRADLMQRLSPRMAQKVARMNDKKLMLVLAVVDRIAEQMPEVLPTTPLRPCFEPNTN